MDASLPLPVRLADMEAVERAYLATAPEERVNVHLRLEFYALLTFGERAALERRYATELPVDPESPSASPGVKIAWDYRARELVVCMLSYADEVLANSLDLAGRVGARDPAVALVLTATGSTIELDAPTAGGARSYRYRPSLRPDGASRDGVAMLAGNIRLGDRLDLDDLRTSELLVVASGPRFAGQDQAARADRNTALLFTPDQDAAPEAVVDDELRVELIRFRVLVDAAGNAEADDRPVLIKRMTALAVRIQQALATGGGVGDGADLAEVVQFRTGSGSRYEVAAYAPEGARLLRTPRHLTEAIVLERTTAAGQRLVMGAPLVLTHDGFDGQQVVSSIHAIADIKRRPPA